MSAPHARAEEAHETGAARAKPAGRETPAAPEARAAPEEPDAPKPRRVLEARGLTKRYPGADAPAVDDVGLAVREGEIVAVVGESGCGKTTLLRLVAGLEVPDRGEVRLGGRAVAGGGAWVPPEHRGVGMLFQDFALFPHLRVAENVAFGLHGHPRPERRRRARAMLERVGLGGLADRHPHQLSGGQQQRVALARALAPEPRLLLLDEPFSHLDAPLKAELREEVAEVLRRSGVPALPTPRTCSCSPTASTSCGRDACSRAAPPRRSSAIPGTCTWPASSAR